MIIIHIQVKWRWCGGFSERGTREVAIILFKIRGWFSNFGAASMVESNTLQEVFPILYLGPSPSLQELESTVDSTIDIPDNPPLEQDSKITHRILTLSSNS